MHTVDTNHWPAVDSAVLFQSTLVGRLIVPQTERFHIRSMRKDL